MKLSSGNAVADGAPFHSWFVGNLYGWTEPGLSAAQPDFGLRASSTVEMKWGTHSTGERRTEWAACSEKMTMSLLVRGKFLLRFRSPGSRAQITEQLLAREGDYAIWGAGTEHTWVVMEDAVIFTVRWKENSL
jgi:hypothetical protein